MGREYLSLYCLFAFLHAVAQHCTTCGLYRFPVRWEVINSDKLFWLQLYHLVQSGIGRVAYLSSPPSSKLQNSGSVHVENFSKMYAPSPTGESFKPQPEKEENFTGIVIPYY